MADQHNDNIPAVTNQIVNDIPDIKENLEYHKDVFERLVQTWSSTDATGIDFSTTPTFNNGSVEIAWPSNNMSTGSPKIMVGDSYTIAWFYLNTAPPGWKALSTGADSVLGVAGGSGDYDVNGGNPDKSATWTIDGLTHCHQWFNTNASTVSDHSWQSDGSSTKSINAGETKTGGGVSFTTAANTNTHDSDLYTKDETLTSDASWRPKASVGKLFQLDTA